MPWNKATGNASRISCRHFRTMMVHFRMTGNMVDAMEAWREAEKQSLSVNDDVICAGGLGALSYRQQEDAADDEFVLQDKIYWLHALQGLLNRTLLAWLTVLGIMTLSGWLT